MYPSGSVHGHTPQSQPVLNRSSHTCCRTACGLALVLQWRPQRWAGTSYLADACHSCWECWATAPTAVACLVQQPDHQHTTPPSIHPWPALAAILHPLHSRQQCKACQGSSPLAPAPQQPKLLQPQLRPRDPTGHQSSLPTHTLLTPLQLHQAGERPSHLPGALPHRAS
jgi:hypothetical protein